MSIEIRKMIKEATIVEYCNSCGLPTDYCEYGNCEKNSKTKDTNAQVDELQTNLKSSLKVEDSKNSQESTLNKSEESKNNKKKKKQNIITIKVESRARRKNVTVVTGLELFDISLSEAAKKFAKQFSCGASVVKGNHGKTDQIDVQGDFDVTIAEFILKLYPHIEESNIVIQS